MDLMGVGMHTERRLPVGLAHEEKPGEEAGWTVVWRWFLGGIADSDGSVALSRPEAGAPGGDFLLEEFARRRHKWWMPINPPHLKHGDTIGIIAPASAPPDPKAIDRSITALEGLGFKTKLAPNARRRWGFLAGDDRDRAGDLMVMFTDPKVDAILCVRGGYGTSRLLARLDYAAIRRHPKIFTGYSDITSLHFAFLKRANLVSFHGPMLNSDFVKDDLPDFTLASFLRTVTQTAPSGSVCRGYTKKTVSVLREGNVSGPLLGGNLTLICASLGTPYQPSFRGKILFFEDLEEVPYRFDRMLTQLLNAGLLQQVKGIALSLIHI